MLLFQEVSALPSRPTLLFATSCFLSQPQQPFPPSEQIQAIVSACAKWRRGGKGPVGLGQMLRGWNFLKCIGCQQWDAFCRSNKVICVSSSFTLLKAANPEMFNQPLVVPSPPKYERQNCWQEEKRREFMSFYKLIWAMRTCYQPCLESGPEASGASCFPALTCLPESPFTPLRGVHWAQLFNVFWWEIIAMVNFQPMGDLIPWIFYLLCACLCLI